MSVAPDSAARWFLDALGGVAEPSAAEIECHLGEELLTALGTAGWQQRFAYLSAGTTITETQITAEGFSFVVSTRRGHQVLHIDAVVQDGRIISLNEQPVDIDGLTFATTASSEADEHTLADVHELFDRTYRNADHAYLDRSLHTLRNLATCRDDTGLIGFALGETRTVNLPRLPETVVCLAGLACVSPERRRQGIFGRLSNDALATGAPGGIGSHLSAGRMAHPASLRSLAGLPSVVPKPGVAPSPWHQQVGTAIANLYGVERFDPHSFVCRGDGKGIGEPIIDLDVADHEWDLFQPVNRARGDALLAIAWSPIAPDGW